MNYRVLLLLSPATDPSIYKYALEHNEEIQGVDCVTGDTEEGLAEAKSAFSNGYSVVGTDLLLSHSDVLANLDGYTAQIYLAGFRVLEEGVAMGFAQGFDANFVVLSGWDHPNHVFESYRLGAKSFISTRHSLVTGEFIESVMGAARGECSYPNMNPSVRNIAVALNTSDLQQLSPGELQIIDLIVNEQTTSQIQKMVGSVSKDSTSQRIAKICRKLNLQNREAVADYAIRAGMKKHGEVGSVF